MSKHLTEKQRIKIIKINDKLSTSKAVVEYLKITGKKVETRELVRRIRNKSIKHYKEKQAAVDLQKEMTLIFLRLLTN